MAELGGGGVVKPNSRSKFFYTLKSHKKHNNALKHTLYDVVTPKNSLIYDNKPFF